MSVITLFEAKAQISELVRRVAAGGESVVLTVRGKPMVRIIPYVEEAPAPDAWEVREKVIAQYGVPDFVAPPRSIESPRTPFIDN